MKASTPKSTKASAAKAVIAKAASRNVAKKNTVTKKAVGAPTGGSHIANLNRQGEQRRISGDHTGAIEAFDEVLAQAPDNTWTLAHRGAAKSAMGLFQQRKGEANAPTGAIEDLERALELKDGQYAWARAQLGEAYRCVARDSFPFLMKKERYDELLALTEKAELAFTHVLADDSHQDDAWALAHRGAARALIYVVQLHKAQQQGSRRASAGAGYDVLAEQDFQQAISLNPGYSWALASYGFLLTLKKQFGAARVLADRAAATDTFHRLHIARTMAQLFYYEEQWDQAITQGSEAVRANPEDFLARYILAASMVQRDDSPLAHAFLETSRRQLLEVRSLVNYLLASIDQHAGLDQGGGSGPLEDARKHPALESIGLFEVDPVWADTRTHTPRLLAGTKKKTRR